MKRVDVVFEFVFEAFPGVFEHHALLLLFEDGVAPLVLLLDGLRLRVLGVLGVFDDQIVNYLLRLGDDDDPLVFLVLLEETRHLVEVLVNGQTLHYAVQRRHDQLEVQLAYIVQDVVHQFRYKHLVELLSYFLNESELIQHYVLEVHIVRRCQSSREQVLIARRLQFNLRDECENEQTLVFPEK